MTRKRVLLDCDGILSDFVGAALSIVHEVTGRLYERDQWIGFDIASLGLTSSEAGIVKSAIGGRAGLASYLTPYPGAVVGVQRLRTVAEVYIVTSPYRSNPTWTHDREWWLHRHFKIPACDIIHTSAKHVCAGDMLIDDNTATLLEWQRAHPSRDAVQWITPHNRLDGWTGEATSDWGELVEMVRGDR